MKLGSVLAAGGVLQRGRSVPPAQNLISGWPWSDDVSSNTAAGVRVTRENAAQLLAVYGSVSLVTDQVSTTPINIDGSRRPAWIDEPSDGLDRVAWLGQIAWSILLDGGAYMRSLSRRGEIIAVDVLDPVQCDVTRESGRRVVTVEGTIDRNAFYIPGRMLPGALKGMAPVEYARQTIGLGLAAQKYGSEFFDGPGNLEVAIEYPHAMQPETIEQDAKRWQRNRKKGGRGLPGIVQAGGVVKSIGVTNEQAQFLATRQYTAAEIAGQMFLLDPVELGIPTQGTSLNYNNQQDRDSRRTRVAILPLVRRIEPALSRLIPNGQYRFDLDAQLRGNTKESYETLKVAIDAGFMTPAEAREILGLADQIPTDDRVWQEVGLPALVQGGIMTPNEARAQLGLPPVPGGDELRPPEGESNGPEQAA